MRVLHVSLGDPEQHQGGLNRYCRDLMHEQVLNGYKVMLLYAGRLSLAGKPVIQEVSSDKYALQNCLPVPITYGIDNPERYMRKSDISVFKVWLKEVQPEVIHVHSIQGIYLEFFQAANELNIPVYFTTHDYYPICFRSTLVKNTGELCNGRSPEQCAKCNHNAGLSGIKQFLLQSRMYQRLKRNKVVAVLRKNTTAQVAQKVAQPDTVIKVSAKRIQDFAVLGEYYDRILDCFTAIYANSQRTCEVYQNFRPDLKYLTIPITRVGLKRTAHQRRENAPIRFGYMGGMSVHKGYEMFQSALVKLDEAGYTDWEAWYYGGEYAPAKEEQLDHRRHYCGLFGPAQETEVWANIDVLLVPCVGGETYGLVVLEALCHGIPVICSDLAGSKFLVEKVGKNLVVPHNQSEAYTKAMIWLMNRTNYTDVKCLIDETEWPTDFEEHCNEICAMYKTAEKGEVNNRA